jgi:hypothetical protein
MEKAQDNEIEQTQPQPVQSRPNENGMVHVDAFVKIKDPNTDEVFYEGRA